MHSPGAISLHYLVGRGRELLKKLIFKFGENEQFIYCDGKAGGKEADDHEEIDDEYDFNDDIDYSENEQQVLEVNSDDASE